MVSRVSLVLRPYTGSVAIVKSSMDFGALEMGIKI